MHIKHILSYTFILLTSFVCNPSSSFALTNTNSLERTNRECTDHNLFLKAVRSSVPRGQGIYERVHHVCFNSEKNKIIIQARIGENSDEEVLYLVHADKSTCKTDGLTAVDFPLPANLGKDAPYPNWDFSSVVNCVPYTIHEESNDQSHSDQQDSGAVQ